MRLIILSQYYPPEMGAPQARLSDLARRFKQLRHEVTVLTAMPNYPTGKVYKGYPHCYMREELEGICVYRSWIVPSNGCGMSRRLVSYLSFSLSSFWVGLFKTKRSDIILTESPPLFLAVTGWLLSVLKGARWILNISDLWPDSAKYIGMFDERSVIYKTLQVLAHFLYKRAFLVSGQSREIISEIKQQSPSMKGYHLSNGVDILRFHPNKKKEEIRRRFLKDGEVGFVYAGLHGLFQGLNQVIMAATRLKEKPVRFILIGDGPEKAALVRAARKLGLSNVNFYPPISHKQIPSILSSMDVALITLKASICGAIPSKIYEAMAGAVPILLVAGGEAARIVQNTGAGVTIRPGDIDGLVRAAGRMASDAALRLAMGRAGRKAAETLYNRSIIAAKFETLLRSSK